MEFPKNRFFNEQHKPLKDGVTSNISLTCNNEVEWNKSGNLNAVKWDGDTPSLKTDEEIYQDSVPNLKVNLKSQCMIYQVYQYGVDSNFYGMLMHVQDFTDKPKCQSVLDGCDALWADYYERKAKIEAHQEYTEDFSNHGVRPYSFAECRAEITGI